MWNTQSLLWIAAMAVAAGLVITAAGGRRDSLIEVLRSYVQKRVSPDKSDPDAERNDNSDKA